MLLGEDMNVKKSGITGDWQEGLAGYFSNRNPNIGDSRLNPNQLQPPN